MIMQGVASLPAYDLSSILKCNAGRSGRPRLDKKIRDSEKRTGRIKRAVLRFLPFLQTVPDAENEHGLIFQTIPQDITPLAERDE